ncbi:MAG: NUDIX hydrolase [Chlamydiota bacterium]
MTQKPKVQSTKILYSGFFEIKQDLLQKPDGQTLAYTSLVLSTDASAILAQDEQGLWILNREYRHPTGKYVLGCPGGRLDEGEDPIEGAKRELLEETGYWAEKIELIGTSYPSPSFCNQKIYYFFAKNAVKKAEQGLDPFEWIQTELKTDRDLYEEIRTNTSVDSVLCAALWYLDMHRKKHL